MKLPFHLKFWPIFAIQKQSKSLFFEKLEQNQIFWFCINASFFRKNVLLL